MVGGEGGEVLSAAAVGVTGADPKTNPDLEKHTRRKMQ